MRRSGRGRGRGRGRGEREGERGGQRGRGRGREGGEGGGQRGEGGGQRGEGKEGGEGGVRGRGRGRRREEMKKKGISTEETGMEKEGREVLTKTRYLNPSISDIWNLYGLTTTPPAHKRETERQNPTCITKLQMSRIPKHIH